MLLKRLVKFKIKLQYAYGWVSAFGMAFIITDIIQRRLEIIGVILPFWQLFIVGGILLLIFGTILIKIGVLDLENSFRTSHNTELKRLLKIKK